jgi:hypothetical protein
VLIEDRFSGISLLQELQLEIYCLEAYRPEAGRSSSKVAGSTCPTTHHGSRKLSPRSLAVQVPNMRIKLIRPLELLSTSGDTCLTGKVGSLVASAGEGRPVEISDSMVTSSGLTCTNALVGSPAVLAGYLPETEGLSTIDAEQSRESSRLSRANALRRATLRVCAASRSCSFC